MRKVIDMDRLLSNLRIVVPEKIFLKDPESSDLGRRIVRHGILLIDEIGFEAFTFKKLGQKIGSNESSIYRYFESKHKFLLYLSSWYWGWLEYQLVIETHSLATVEDKLRKAIEVFSRPVKEDSSFTHVDEVVLNRIMINENSKSFLTKEVDQENKDGFFVIFKRLVVRLKDLISTYDPGFPHSMSLAAMVIEGALFQHFLKDHFKSITDCGKNTTPTEFFTELVFRTLNNINHEG